MKLMKLAAVLCAGGSLAVGALAQDKPGNIAGLEFQTPKSGMVKQYEEGRKAKVEWHKQQKDTQPLFVSQIVSGEHTGQYIVGRFGMHWADMDKPSVPDAADMEEYNKVVSPYVEKMVAAYYEFLPKWSNPSPDMNAKYIAVTTFHIRFGKGDDFQSAIAKVHEANEKLTAEVIERRHNIFVGKMLDAILAKPSVTDACCPPQASRPRRSRCRTSIAHLLFVMNRRHRQNQHVSFREG